MGKFFGAEPFRVEFPDGEYIDIKSEFSQTDLDCISNNMMKARVNIPTNGQSADNPELALHFGKQATLERAILSWSFKDEKDKPVPVTPDNISDLRYKYRFVVLKEIDRLTKEAGVFAKN